MRQSNKAWLDDDQDTIADTYENPVNPSAVNLETGVGSGGFDKNILMLPFLATTNRTKGEFVGLKELVTDLTDIEEEDLTSLLPYFTVDDLGTDYIGKWGVVKDDTESGKVGRVIISGTIFTTLQVDDEEYLFVDIDDSGDIKAVNSGSGQIIWKESGTGEKNMIIRFPFGTGGTVSLYKAVADQSGSTIDVKACNSDGTVEGDIITMYVVE